jgi:hypothetical protein
MIDIKNSIWNYDNLRTKYKKMVKLTNKIMLCFNYLNSVSIPTELNFDSYFPIWFFTLIVQLTADKMINVLKNLETKEIRYARKDLNLYKHVFIITLSLIWLPEN